MQEKIYTIPVTEAFSKKSGCPFCALKNKLEDDERELIMGASMMEPDIRIKTNALGFCKRHFDKMLTMNNKLSLGLMLESHLNEISKKTTIWKDSFIGKDNSKKASENMKAIAKSCYICQRCDEKFEKMIACAILLWQKDSEFRQLFSEQHFFCFEHASILIDYASERLDKKQYSHFCENIGNVMTDYADSLKEDVSWFCKKFDYRYDNEPWGNSKDAVERAIKFLESDI